MTISSKINLKFFLSNGKIWLFFATVNFALWYGVLNYRIENNDLLITAFFVLVALFLFWKKRKDIVISPQILASLVGFLILGWSLTRGTSMFWFEYRFARLLPLITFFALALITSGWNLKQYIRPFCALFFLSLVGFINQIFSRFHQEELGISRLTAQASSFLLHYLGFDVSSQGVYVHLNTGSVEVWYPCTGGPLITLLFQLTLGLVLVIPINWNLLSKLLLGILGLGFFLGVVRVALLAVVVSNEAAFDYWHGDEGNQIFSLIAFSIWMIGTHFVYENYENTKNNKNFSSLEKETTEKKNSDLSREELATTLSLRSPRSWLVPIAGVMMAIVTVLTILLPQIGRRELSALRLPSQLSLSGWKEQESTSLVTDPESELRFDRLHSGQEYHYQKQQTQVRVALRFFSPTFGNTKKYIQEAYDKEFQKNYEQGNTRYLSNLGYYHLFTNEEKAYLSACLNPTFESTVSSAQYARQANKHFFERKNLIPRLLGQKSFRERRCLWVNLSTPLNPDSPETSYQILESVFKAGYTKWQGLFENQ